MDDRYGRRYDEDDERRFSEWAPRDYEARRDRGEGPSAWRGGYERHERPGDRGFLDRAGDELRSWFGDEEAEQRRRDDEREARRREPTAQRWREGRGSWSRPDDREREWARQWGYVDRPWDRSGAYGGRQMDERARENQSGLMRDDAWVTRGPFSGRGPKGYQRSDERIREDVCDVFCEHGALDASDVEVQVIGRVVTLIGFVPTRSQKRLAEDLADSVSGVNEVHNQLRLSQSASTGLPEGFQSSGGQPGPTDWRNRAA
jgi:hypothetical protein